ncbi:MAG: CoB--CoM heterodisulfide reductase iron-sulfur subunit A family protein [Planctomycetota bacterium]|nr:MAG: CoB--CoM heterodisulfide reductase iron-sulfur subunit A family protein [Planctomycetota bacterium]
MSDAPQEKGPRFHAPLRVGVYVCRCGGNISDVVDVEKVAEMAEKLPDVVVARVHTFMCSDPGQGMIEKDVRELRLNRVIVASCAPSLHETTFRLTVMRAGLNPFLYEHANIREQVSWSHKSTPDEATEKAFRLVAAAVAKARTLQPLEPVRVTAERRVVVIGGGITGLKAAVDLSRRGFGVTLVEKTPFLGGRVARLDKLFPTETPAREVLAELFEKVQNDPSIEVLTLTEVKGISGALGMFDVTLETAPRGVTGPLDDPEKVFSACPVEVDDEFDYGLSKRKAIYMPWKGCAPALPAIDFENCTKCGKCVEAAGGKGIELDGEPVRRTVKAGAVLIATGFDLYDHTREYGHLPNVVTLPQLIRMLDEEGPTGGRLVWNGKEVKRIGFLHCVGSRQVAGIHEPPEGGRLNEYCSRVCCTATLHAAVEVRKRFPDTKVFDFYQDIRTYGRGHEDFYEDASNADVLFFRWRVEDQPVVEEGSSAPLAVRVKDQLSWNEELETDLDLLVLAVGMVPRDNRELLDVLKVPSSSDGFLQEVHPKLRPVETAVPGILLAGTAQSPMDTVECASSAAAAAAKAAAMLWSGYIELEPFIANVDEDKCTGCGDCLAACNYDGALSIVEKEKDGAKVKVAAVNAALCKGCGACVAVCPERAIDINGWTLEQYEAMVEAFVADYDENAEEQK